MMTTVTATSILPITNNCSMYSADARKCRDCTPVKNPPACYRPEK